MREYYRCREVADVVERRSSTGIVPLYLHKFWGQGLCERYGVDAIVKLGSRFPDDVVMAYYREPGFDLSSNANPSYRWGYKDYTGTETHSIGEAHVLLPDWSELDEFLADFPDPDEPGNFAAVAPLIEQSKREDRYVVGMWWRLFHERFWAIRGMENLMYDYYDDMDNLKLLGQKLLGFYKVLVDRFAALGVDGIFTSDDLGHQSGPMMSPEVFRELYLPLYREIVSYVHGKGLHFWLHSCGDNTLLLPDLIDAGVDVFHPVQKGCMDFAETAGRFGGKISFLAGMDVQDKLPNGTPEEVREEVRRMVQIFGRPGEGGVLLGAGNGIMSDCPLENIEAMLEAMTEAKIEG